jgi:hypothetical protein
MLAPGCRSRLAKALTRSLARATGSPARAEPNQLWFLLCSHSVSSNMRIEIDAAGACAWPPLFDM